MFSGSADGKYMPPMVVYKSENVYEEWVRGGQSMQFTTVPRADI